METEIDTACYCRVSTKKGEQLESLQHQIQFFEELTTKNKEYKLFKIYADEGISGKGLTKRLAFQEMMRDARLGKFKVILVKDITRFARNTIDFLTSIRELKTLKINVKFTSYNMDIKEVDETYLTILSAMAEDESRRLSVKTKFGKNITATKGRVPNFVYGYDKVDRYTIKPNPTESLIVQEIFNLYASESMGTGKIAKYLTDKRIVTKKNKQTGWTQKTVIDILRNEIYIGNVINKKSEIENFPSAKRTIIQPEFRIVVEKPEFAIIEPELFYHVQDLLKERVNSFNLLNKRSSHKYLFSNLIKCAECGYSFRRNKRKYSENGKEYIYWSCSYRNAHGADSCLNKIKIFEDECADAILKRFELLLEGREKKSREIFITLKELISHERDHNEYKEIEITLKELIKEKDRVDYMFKKGKITIEKYEEFSTPLEKDIEQATIILSNGNKRLTFTDADLKKSISNLFDSLIIDKEKMDNAFLKEKFINIEVNKNGNSFINPKLDNGMSLTLPLYDIVIK